MKYSLLCTAYDSVVKLCRKEVTGCNLPRLNSVVKDGGNSVVSESPKGLTPSLEAVGQKVLRAEERRLLARKPFLSPHVLQPLLQHFRSFVRKSKSIKTELINVFVSPNFLKNRGS